MQGGTKMDQMKIGSFLKELRKEKNLTQEQLAEQFYTSRRTVSRWETGSNMPDLDVLIDLADFYGVELRELLDGERKSEKMDKELEETVLKVADYSNEEKIKFTKLLHWMFILGLIAILANFVMEMVAPVNPSKIFDFFKGLTLGISTGMILIGVIYTSKKGAKFREFKERIISNVISNKE